LPATLEVLETQGVPIVGLGTDTLPGFYSRTTGLPIDVRVETPREAAAIVAAARRLDAQHGVLIVVPVPAADEFPEADANAAVAQAIAEAEARGLRGKGITPFLLRRVSEITGGGTQLANSALLVNSARVAGAIAFELSRFT
jgi:pseudouridylate synthase